MHSFPRSLRICCVGALALAFPAAAEVRVREIAPDALAAREPLSVIALSPDGRTVAAGGPSGHPFVALWEVETGRLLHRWSASHHVNGLGFSADGRRVYAMSMGGQEHLEI